MRAQFIRFSQIISGKWKISYPVDFYSYLNFHFTIKIKLINFFYVDDNG